MEILKPFYLLWSHSNNVWSSQTSPPAALIIVLLFFLLLPWSECCCCTLLLSFIVEDGVVVTVGEDIEERPPDESNDEEVEIAELVNLPDVLVVAALFVVEVTDPGKWVTIGGALMVVAVFGAGATLAALLLGVAIPGWYGCW